MNWQIACGLVLIAGFYALAWIAGRVSMRTMLVLILVWLAGLGVVAVATAAPVVIVNGTCTVTPIGSTVFTLDASQNVVVTGKFSGDCTNPLPPPTPGVCTPQSGSDLNALGYTRACSGGVVSKNSNLRPKWDNTYAGLMSGPWPGAKGQFGFGLIVTFGANTYGSFAFNTGATPAGVSFTSNPSYGLQGVVSVSTVPGDTYGGTAMCASSTLNISSKPGTMAQCKLALNTEYYVNFSMANPFPPHGTMCEAASCSTGWTAYSYGN